LWAYCRFSKNYAFLRIDNRILSSDIFIPLDKLKGGKDGQKAIARMTEWNAGEANPKGECGLMCWAM
jgi:ribonuclease R